MTEAALSLSRAELQKGTSRKWLIIVKTANNMQQISCNASVDKSRVLDIFMNEVCDD